MSKRLLIGISLAALMSLPGVTLAQPSTSAAAIELYGDMAIGTTERETTALGQTVSTGAFTFLFEFGGTYPIMPELRLSLDWGFDISAQERRLSGFIDQSDDTTVALPANPALGAHYLFELTARVRGRVGGLLVIPLIHYDEDDTEELLETALASMHPLGMNAARNAWLWTPEYFSLVVPASVQGRNKSGNLRWGADTAVALMFDTDDENAYDDDGKTLVVFQLGGEFAYQPASSFELGGRLSAAFGFAKRYDDDEDDTSQIAIEPFGAYLFDGGRVEGALTVNLDEPFGFAFNEARIWALHVRYEGTI